MLPQQTKQRPLNILTGFAQILGILGLISFFSGWIYRWSYFNYFNLDLTRLNYPPQSFLLVPLQLFLRRPENLIKAALALAVLPIVIQINLDLIHFIARFLLRLIRRVSEADFIKNMKPNGSLKNWLLEKKRSYVISIKAYKPLINELVIVLWVTSLVYWISQWQGSFDAQQDAVHRTSSLPVVTFVGKQKDFILGTDLRIIEPNGIPPDPAISGSVIIGDLTMARFVRQSSINDASTERVWHFLTERDGWVYIFPSLKAAMAKRYSPIVITFPKAEGDQLMILGSTLPMINQDSNKQP